MAFQTWVIDQALGVRCSGCDEHGVVLVPQTEGDINADLGLDINDVWCGAYLPDHLRDKNGPRPLVPHACTEACERAAMEG